MSAGCNKKEVRSNPVKILFLIDELNVGGTEKQLIWLCEKLPRDRFLPTLGVLRRSDYEQSKVLNTPVVTFDWQGLPLVKNLQLIDRLRKFLEEEQFEILQTQFVESEIYGCLAVFSLRKRPKLIVTRRNLYHWIGDDPWRFRVVRHLARYVDHLLVNSFAVQAKCRELEAVCEEKITVIQNAIAMEKFGQRDSQQAKMELGLGINDFVVGVVGNWRPVKGLASFLTAAKNISEKIPAARFVLAGDGPQDQELRDLGEKLGIGNRVLYIKNPPDIPGVIASMDVAVQSSLSESFSNVLLEYMASGKPIVATRVGDASVMLAHEKSGLLVEPGNSAAMSDSVVRLYRNPAWAGGLGAHAREKASQWSETVIRAKYISFYGKVLTDRKGGA
jgi:glycosyltransferase involved in cell wall biosynthesis